MSVFVPKSAETLLADGLAVAQAAGLAVTSWRVDDIARVLLKFAAETLGAREVMAAAFVDAGFLSTATEDWLTLLAYEVYDVTRVAATYATSTVSLTNSGGGYYEITPGSHTFRSALSGVTYTATGSLTLAAGDSGTVTVSADTAGSDGSAGVDDIDEIVTTMLGVAITASTAAVGLDAQSDESLRTQCRATLGALSPNGPPDAYEYVARNPALTGTSEVTRAYAVTSGAGTVDVWVTGATGDVSAGAITLVQAAIDTYATPLTVDATVDNADEVLVDVTATVSGSVVPADVEDLCEAALGAMFAEIPIGGVVARSAIIAAIHGVLVAAGVSSPTVTLTAPAADIDLDDDEVARLDDVTVGT